MTELNVDQSHWGVVAVTGADRLRFVHNMCTANISALRDGQWARAAILNVKGRVVSVVEAIARGEQLLLLCEPGVAEPTLELLQKHAIMDEVEFELRSEPIYRVWGAPAEAWAASPQFGSCPQPVATPEQVEVRRVEAGIPRYGIDVTAERFPFESRLVEHIDYDKGCYLGQEPVSRVKHQGQASWLLCGLLVAGDGGLAVGSPVQQSTQGEVGLVTSAVVSPRLGSIALAYLKRRAAEPGTELLVGDRSAIVQRLPFSIG